MHTALQVLMNAANARVTLGNARVTLGNARVTLGCSWNNHRPRHVRGQSQYQIHDGLMNNVI